MKLSKYRFSYLVSKGSC